MPRDYRDAMQARRKEMEFRLKTCDPANAERCQDLTRDAARLAHQVFMPHRFGWFTGGDITIVFSNMGEQTLFARDTLCRELDTMRVPTLGLATWPGSIRSNDSYTWAVAVHDPDAERWCNLARRCWVHGNYAY